MPAKIRTAVMAAGAAGVTAVAVLSAATPAFAKANYQLSGPRAARVGHAFRLTASWGNDAFDAVPPPVRLQVLNAHGQYQWLGSWHRLRSTDQVDDSYVFTTSENHRGAFTFRAVFRAAFSDSPASFDVSSYPVKVTVR
jgi:hypothetical protein